MNKLTEVILATALFRSERITAAAGVTGTTYYNGAPITSASGYGLDTKGFKDVVIAINVGTILGETTSLLNSVYESDTDDPTAAELLSGASFTTAGSSSDELFEAASLNDQEHARYLFLVTEIQKPSAITPTIDFSAVAVLGQAQNDPTAQGTLAFDL